jgi:flagellar basal-body rod modification protein FlgD
MTSSVQSGAPATDAGQAAGSAATASSKVSKDMFLQLLIAQIKNQDPLNPADSVQFMTQLAQFQQLEQSMNMEQDIQAIRGALERIAPAESAGSTETQA